MNSDEEPRDNSNVVKPSLPKVERTEVPPFPDWPVCDVPAAEMALYILNNRPDGICHTTYFKNFLAASTMSPKQREFDGVVRKLGYILTRPSQLEQTSRLWVWKKYD